VVPPFWTGPKREPAPRPTRAAGWRPREAPTLTRRALLIGFGAGFAFGYALAGPLPGLLAAALAILQRSTPAFTLAGPKPSQPGLIAAFLGAGTESDQRQHELMFTVRSSTGCHPDPQVSAGHFQSSLNRSV